MSRLSLLVAAFIAAASLPGTSTGGESRVIVDALVLDREGKPVRGLSRGDFEIAIGEQIHPVADVRMVTAGPETRRFVFVVNRRGALPAQLQRLKNDLQEFVSRHLGGRDEALFVDFAEVTRTTREWRRGPAEALSEIRGITPMGFQRITPRELRSPLRPAEDAADAVVMLGALAGRLAETPGRKVVLCFSGSLSTFAGEPGGVLQRGLPWVPADVPSSKAGAEDAVEILRYAFSVANASIYAIHLEGARRQDDGILEATRSEIIGRSNTSESERDRSSHDAFMDDIPRGMRRARDSSASLSGRRRQSFSRPTDDFLSSLAAETGGAYTAHATDFTRILEDIEQSNRLWYELRFDPFGTGSPGRYQPHTVRVRNRPDLKVVFRPGHVIPN